jgi:hypothetical protein
MSHWFVPSPKNVWLARCFWCFASHWGEITENTYIGQQSHRHVPSVVFSCPIGMSHWCVPSLRKVWLARCFWCYASHWGEITENTYIGQQSHRLVPPVAPSAGPIVGFLMSHRRLVPSVVACYRPSNKNGWPWFWFWMSFLSRFSICAFRLPLVRWVSPT